MPRLLHLADLHLGWTPHDPPNDVAHAIRRERDGRLGEAVALALETRVDAVVIAGDLFEHYRPEPALVATVVRELRSLEAAGIRVITVPGNHDELSYARSVYRTEAAWPGVLVTRPDPGPVATLELGGARVALTSLAYVGGVTPVHEPLRHFPREEADVALAVFHGTLVASGRRPGDPFGGGRSLPIDVAALADAGFDYVALGHLHVPSQRRLGAHGLAVYPGCVGGKGPRDAGSEHWTLVEIGAAGVRLEVHPAQVAPVWSRDLDVGPFDDPQALIAALVALGGPQTWARVRLTGSLAFDLELASVQSHAAASFRQLALIDATTSVAPAHLDRLAAQTTVRGAFVRDLAEQLERAEDDDARARITRALRLGLAALAGGR
jgi:DNA repair exonuclease SbcCD nuclease subunit